MTDSDEFHLYIILCDQKILYTGIAIDPKNRLKQHQNGHPLGAKFTRRFKQLELIYQVKVGNRSLAQSLECKIKRLNKAKKQLIIERQLDTEQLLILLKPTK
jgi:putative endonuclease